MDSSLSPKKVKLPVDFTMGVRRAIEYPPGVGGDSFDRWAGIMKEPFSYRTIIIIIMFSCRKIEIEASAQCALIFGAACAEWQEWVNEADFPVERP